MKNSWDSRWTDWDDEELDWVYDISPEASFFHGCSGHVTAIPSLPPAKELPL